jgi:hypothetical protein
MIPSMPELQQNFQILAPAVDMLSLSLCGWVGVGAQALGMHDTMVCILITGRSDKALASYSWRHASPVSLLVSSSETLESYTGFQNPGKGGSRQILPI